MASGFPKRITRRNFVAGAAAASVAATAALTLDGCEETDSHAELVESIKAQFPGAQVEFLDVDPSQVLHHTDMAEQEGIDYLRETYNFELPLGSLVYQSSDTHALVLAPGASSKALIRLGIVEFASGNFTTLLGQALGAREDFVIYDARASGEAIAWVECNMVHGIWRVFAVTLEDGMTTEEAMRQAQPFDEGQASYVPPYLAVSGTKVYWTVMPDPHGPASAEDSYLKTVILDKRNPGQRLVPSIIYTSHGRMITNPIVSGDVLTIVPRVDTDLVFYQLTTLDIKTNAVKNIAILPQSVRVSDAVWLGEGFVFGIEANYDYAQGLSLFGTYLQLGGGRYLYVNKAPSSAAMRIDALTCIKSTKNILGLEPTQGNVVIVETLQDCIGYGDILAGFGMQKRLVVYTTVISRFSQSSGRCRVRVFDSLSLLAQAALAAEAAAAEAAAAEAAAAAAAEAAAAQAAAAAAAAAAEA